LSINAILDAFKTHNAAPLLKGIKRGVERECLRIDSERLAQTPHPSALGSALTNKYITTDFSESLLEFITPASADVDDTMAQLHDIHRFTLENLGDEQLWPLSMPCFIDDEDDIQLANYGSSNVGKMKTLYREGLKNRYGSKMQAIAGVHFNLSLPTDFWQKLQQIEGDTQVLQNYISDKYFALIRNFKRELWLMSYLFGASPSLCRSFLSGQKTSLPFENLSKDTLYLPYATSLRLGDLGYTNSAQSSLRVTYNSLDEYLQGFRQAISMKSDLYQKFGDYTNVPAKQLNSNILQIENEFYSPIRPKRNAKPGQTPSEALCEGGVEYIEVRALDVNPFSEVGISKEQIQFLDVFLVYCVLKGSPDLSWQAQIETQANLDLVVNRGRAPDLELSKKGQLVSLKKWANDIFADLKQVALLFDEGFNTQSYSSAIAHFECCIDNPDNTFSGRLLTQLKAEHKESAEFASALAKQYKSQLMSEDYTVFDRTLFEKESAESTKSQREIELADNQSFVDFLSDYFK
jgi:glutamate--cysteine ligase